MVIRIIPLLIATVISMAPCIVSAQLAHPEAPTPSLNSETGRNTVTITGIVRDAENGETLTGVHLYVAGTQIGTTSDLEGRFTIPSIPVGDHFLEARMIGFERYRLPLDIHTPGRVLNLDVQLKAETVPLSEIVVTPGRFAVNSMEAYAPQTFSEDELKNLPQFGEDIYRAVTRLPGLSSSDFSSRFMIRGGEHDEVLVTFDGLELYDPFHMKDIGGGGLSIIDAGSIGGVDLLTGAFPAAYGNRLSGVFNITSSTPSAKHNRSSVGISFINSRVSTEGTTRNEKTSWMAVGRRGYLDVLLGAIDETFSLVPQYYDTFGKIQHRFSNKQSLSVQWLASGDKLTYQDITDLDDRATSRYGNSYFWANWKSIWSNRLYSETVLSRGRIWNDRKGVNIREDEMLRWRVNDNRVFDITNAKQDWTLDLTPGYMLSWGIDAKLYASRYDYFNTRLVQELPEGSTNQKVVTRYVETSWNNKPGGNLISLYSRQRFRLGPKITTELGLRYGTASWTGDSFFDPRINTAYQLGEQTVLRAGWGYFHQVQGIDQLQVPDGAFTFQKAERAEHTVIGLEHLLAPRISLRIDLYNKMITDVRSRYISLAGDVTRLFPEIDPDRVLIHPDKARMQGVELLLQKKQGAQFNWWASYSLSRFEEHLNGTYVPKSHDQRHTIHLDASYNPSPRLHLNLSWQYHTGWKYSDVDLQIHVLKENDLIYDAVYGPYNGEQFPAYHRMDARISYDFQLKKHILATYLEVRNVYNRRNLRLYNYDPAFTSSGDVVYEPEAEYWLPILPAIGIRLDLHH